MSSHDHYEELCGLAVTGQISESQWCDLEAHVTHCSECRDTLRDFNAVAVELTKAGLERDSTEGIPDRMIERVIETVRLRTSASSKGSNGWHSPHVRLLQRPVVRLKPRNRSVQRKYALTAAIASVVIAAFFLGARWERHRFQSGSLRDHEAIGRETGTSHAPGAEVELLRNQLRTLGAREAELSTQLHQREQDVVVGRHKEVDLEARIVLLQTAGAGAEQKKNSDNGEISRLQQELERSRSETEANRKNAVLAEAEIQQLRQTVKTVSQDLADATRLNATSKEVRDLLIDPNVHVWNVHDTDEKGKPQKAFGRLIYVDGKRLTFYAFDLVDQKHPNDQLAFYVWGEKAGMRQPVRKLGVLQVDDARERRWKMAVDNREVLAGVDEVFVTAEPAERLANEPRGKRLLFASLDPNANHP